jgi:subtilisin family serine protease
VTVKSAAKLLCALLAALTPLAAYAQAEAPVVAAEAGEAEPASRHILVMLNLPPAHLRPNAGYAGRYGDTAAQAARLRQARRISRENQLEIVESWPMPLIAVDCFVMRVPEGRAVEEVVAGLNQRNEVVWSQPLNLYHAMASPAPPDDPLFPVQPAATEWRLSDLHQLATGRGVTVAVIDSQVDLAHPDLAGQVAGSRDFVSPPSRGGEDHGTGVAGVIGAKGGNNLGIVGIAPGARMLALRACRERSDRSPRAVCDSLALAQALHFAIDRKAHIINLSLSGPQDRLLGELISVALERRIAIVTSYDPRLAGGGFPASQPGVVAIAEENLRSVPASVYRAPGRDIPTTRPGGTWGLVGGSSFATAHVSGLLALVRERHRDAKVPPRLTRSAGGVVDACATLASVTADCDCSCATGH